jgi:hypothetical protein
MEDDEENAEEAFLDAHSQKLPSIGNDGRRQEHRGGDTDETFAKGDVFEDRLIVKASGLIEQCAANEEGLVAVDNPACGGAASPAAFLRLLVEYLEWCQL